MIIVFQQSDPKARHEIYSDYDALVSLYVLLGESKFTWSGKSFSTLHFESSEVGAEVIYNSSNLIQIWQTVQSAINPKAGMFVNNASNQTRDHQIKLVAVPVRS